MTATADSKAADHEAPNAGSPCAWCDSEAGLTPIAKGQSPISHTVCARHFCMTLLQGGNIPVQAIKDRVARMYGAREGLAAFSAAVRLVALEVTTETQRHGA